MYDTDDSYHQTNTYDSSHTQPPSAAIADRLFQLMDKNADEEISYEEFTEAAHKNPEILKLLFPKPPE